MVIEETEQKKKKTSKEIEEFVRKREKWKEKKELRQRLAGFVASLVVIPAFPIIQLFYPYNTASFWIALIISCLVFGLPLYFLVLWIWPEPSEPKLEETKE